MLPDNEPSLSLVRGSFIGGRAYPVTNFVDYESGGVGIQDPSKGMLYQTWRARLENDHVYISSENTPEYSIFSGSGITEISFSFDQNMRFTLAYVESGNAKLYWYDSTISGMRVTNFGASVLNPRVTMDDKRSSQSSTNDIIFAYVRDGAIYYRQQRDRFQVERFIQGGVSKLKKIGMNDKLRLQFLWE